MIFHPTKDRLGHKGETKLIITARPVVAVVHAPANPPGNKFRTDLITVGVAEDIAQSCSRGMVAAHPVNAAAGWSRRRTQINAAQRCSIWSWIENRSCNQLRRAKGAAANIAAREVRIRLFQIGRAQFVARENAIAETGCEPFDLRFDPLRHVDLVRRWTDSRWRATERNVAIRPECVLSARRARFIK